MFVKLIFFWRTNLWIDANERVCLGVELLLQRDDDGLEVLH